MPTKTSSHDAEMQACIDNCQECYATCTETAQHVLGSPGKTPAMAGLVRTLLDCAESCRTSAGFMLRGSPQHHLTCGVCAEVCRACEQACREAGDDKLLQACADVCRKCAESCERMASHSTHHA
jgi:hypothetical protein